jgi:hypothetical protein
MFARLHGDADRRLKVVEVPYSGYALSADFNAGRLIGPAAFGASVAEGDKPCRRGISSFAVALQNWCAQSLLTALATSALERITDSNQTSRKVRKVPKSEYQGPRKTRERKGSRCERPP